MKIKVNEKNMAMVMGRINKFFQKDTREYVGIKEHIVGYNNVNFMGDIIKVPIREKKETYLPYIGKCTIHPIRKEIEKKIKKGERLFPDDRVRYHKTLLAIFDKYRNYCTPIMAGFEIEITGDKMVIRKNDVCFEYINYDGSIIRTKNKDKSTYVNFYHMPVSETEKHEKVREAASSLFNELDQIFYLEDMFDSGLPQSIIETFRSIHSDLIHSISNIIEGMCLYGKEINVRIFYDEMSEYKKEVFLHINLDAIRNGLENHSDAMYLECEGEKFFDVYNVIEKIMAEEIKNFYDEEDEVSDDDYADYFYDMCF